MILVVVMIILAKNQDIELSQVEWKLKDNQYHTKVIAENRTAKQLKGRITYRGRTKGTSKNVRTDEHTYDIELGPVEKKTIERIVPFKGMVSNVGAGVWGITEKE